MLSSAVGYIVAQTTQPTPVSPPGVGPFLGEAAGYLMYLFGFLAMVMLIVMGGMMIAGRRNRSQLSADALSGLGWWLGGMVLATSASALTNALLA